VGSEVSKSPSVEELIAEFIIEFEDNIEDFVVLDGEWSMENSL
jgi:hypothetical protein